MSQRIRANGLAPIRRSARRIRALDETKVADSIFSCAMLFHPFPSAHVESRRNTGLKRGVIGVIGGVDSEHHARLVRDVFSSRYFVFPEFALDRRERDMLVGVCLLPFVCDPLKYRCPVGHFKSIS